LLLSAFSITQDISDPNSNCSTASGGSSGDMGTPITQKKPSPRTQTTPLPSTALTVISDHVSNTTMNAEETNSYLTKVRKLLSLTSFPHITLDHKNAGCQVVEEMMDSLRNEKADKSNQKEILVEKFEQEVQKEIQTKAIELTASLSLLKKDLLNTLATNNGDTSSDSVTQVLINQSVTLIFNQEFARILQTLSNFQT